MVSLVKPGISVHFYYNNAGRYNRDYAYCDEQLYNIGMTVRRVELTGRHANGRNRYDSNHGFAPLTAYSL